MNVYLVSRSLRHGQDDHVVIALDDQKAARMIDAEVYPWRRAGSHVDVKLIGQAVPGSEEGVVLSCVWSP